MDHKHVMTFEQYSTDFDQKVNEEFMGFSLADKYAKLDKEDDQAVREFFLEMLSKLAVIHNDQVKKNVKAQVMMPQLNPKNKLLAIIEQAAKDDFDGRVKVTKPLKKYEFQYTSIKNLKLASTTAPVVKSHGGVGNS